MCACMPGQQLPSAPKAGKAFCHCNPGGARRMRDMLKCEISMILVSEYTRGAATGRSSSCATAHSARTNSTIASLSRRSLRARGCRVIRLAGLQAMRARSQPGAARWMRARAPRARAACRLRASGQRTCESGASSELGRGCPGKIFAYLARPAQRLSLDHYGCPGLQTAFQAAALQDKRAHQRLSGYTPQPSLTRCHASPGAACDPAR